MNPFPRVVFHFGPLAITDTVVVSFLLSVFLVLGLRLAVTTRKSRLVLEIAYDALERSVRGMSSVDTRPFVPLVVTIWLFVGSANLIGLVPGVASPTRDLSLASALACVSFFAGHFFAARKLGARYLKQYLQPSPFLLPFNIIGEISRTIALALRLFGNMLSGHLISAIMLLIVGLLVPIPLMLLGVLTDVVQAYIFGVLTLVFATSSLEAAEAALTKGARPKKSKAKRDAGGGSQQKKGNKK